MNRSRYKRGLKKRSKEQIQIREKNILYKQTIKNIRETNKRLDKLKKINKEDVYSAKRLKNRLSSYRITSILNNKIKKPSINTTKHKLQALKKATENFLNSLTSTKKGIESMQEEQKKGIRDMFMDNDKEISDKDVEDYYSLFEDDDFNFFADKIGPSTLWIIINTAQTNNDSLEFFFNRLQDYIDFANDDDIKMRAERLYYSMIA